MSMLMTEDSPVSRISQSVTEASISSAAHYRNGTGMWSLPGLENSAPWITSESIPSARFPPLPPSVRQASISSAAHYRNGTGMWSLPGLENSAARLSMSVSMYRGLGGNGRPKTAPPDLPSLLLDARICYLGMPIVPAVTELIVAELLWLDYDNPSKPIYFYINSSGTQNDKRESVGFETEAYAIADTMNVYTVNCGQAFGQAAMLLAIGDKGHRAVQPNAVIPALHGQEAPQCGQRIHSPVSPPTPPIQAKELDANTDYYIELLARGTGKSRDELYRDIMRPKYLHGQEAIDYGVCDKIIESRGVQMEKKVSAVQFSEVQCGAVQCGAVNASGVVEVCMAQHEAIDYGVSDNFIESRGVRMEKKVSALRCGTVQCGAVQYSVMRCIQSPRCGWDVHVTAGGH
ncbi:unnamed protein product [Closterium sp. NIES-54]